MVGFSLFCSTRLTPYQLTHFKGVPVVGGKDCQSVSRTPKHEETWHIGSGVKVTALHTPCHTQDSICYFVEDGSDKAVFTGDTLFIGGT
jgi:hydroxyacylglutathione hydrolase